MSCWLPLHCQADEPGEVNLLAAARTASGDGWNMIVDQNPEPATGTPRSQRSSFTRFVVICAVMFGAIAVPVRAQTPVAPPSSPASQSLVSDQAPANVTAWNRVLAVFRTSFGSSTAQQRADASSARIDAAIERLSPDNLQYSVVEVGGYRGALIVGGTETLLAILEGDLPQDTATTLDAAGAQVVNRLRTLLRDRAEQRRLPTLIRSIAEALFATVVFVAFWLMIRRATERLRRLTAKAASTLR